jgi:1,2-diacylglycerol 3-alpha-glucosyltransferase
MKPSRVVIMFDSHTPYLAFRVNALQRELVARGLGGIIELHVILIGANWSAYGWSAGGPQRFYEVPVHVLSKEFHGLGLRSFFHPSLPGIFLRLAMLFFRLGPRITLVGGPDRPESLFCRIFSYFNFSKVGVMNDSRFNDAESYSKNIVLELIKSLVVARYSFFMVPGQESADYHRFLAGRKRPIYTEAWDVVDNEGIALAADDATRDDELCQRLGIRKGDRFFFFPARFVAKKNIPFVLRAFASFVRNTGGAHERNHHLVLCGQGPEKEVITRTIAQHSLEKLVKVCDWLPYELMPRACRLSTALILASTHDQWGMTVNESLAAGTPVLVSDRCGAYELVQNGDNGFTFRPRDEKHLSSLMQRLQDDPALVDRLRAACRPSVSRFSIRQYVERHLEVLEQYGLLPRTELSNVLPEPSIKTGAQSA